MNIFTFKRNFIPVIILASIFLLSIITGLALVNEYRVPSPALSTDDSPAYAAAVTDPLSSSTRPSVIWLA